MYYIVVNEKKVGPVSLEGLKDFYLRNDTLVWKEGLEKWTTAETLPELAPYISSYGKPSAMRATATLSEPKPFSAMGVEKTPEMPSSKESNAPKTGTDTNPLFNIMPRTWLLESFLITFFCCNILGIIALTKALRVESNFLAGRQTEALRYSKEAKKWVFVALFTGIGLYAIFILLYFLIFAAIIAEGAFGGINI